MDADTIRARLAKRLTREHRDGLFAMVTTRAGALVDEFLPVVQSLIAQAVAAKADDYANLEDGLREGYRQEIQRLESRLAAKDEQHDLDLGAAATEIQRLEERIAAVLEYLDEPGEIREATLRRLLTDDRPVTGKGE